MFETIKAHFLPQINSEAMFFNLMTSNNMHILKAVAEFIQECDVIYRGYSNVFVKYVFYFTSEVDNIYIS